MTCYSNIETFLSDNLGLNPESVGRKSIEDAIKLCMDKRMISDEDIYMKMLISNQEEIEKLIDQVVVSETWFFRDRESFNFLRRYVEKLKESLCQGTVLRVLSVPCSTGEEPYSIAMALLDAGLSPEQFCVDAIDISRRSIGIAKNAVYGKGSFRGECSGYKPRFFIKTEDGFRLEGYVAGMVHFYLDNFVKLHVHNGHQPYHILFCKNLLIYLNDDARKQVFKNIDRFLFHDGIVFTGHSEMMSFLENGYEPIKHARAFACKKIGSKDKMQLETFDRPFSAKRNIMPQNVTKDVLHTHDSHLETKSIDDKHFKNSEPKDVLERVRKLADRGNLTEALRLCGLFLKEHSDNKEAYYLMGLINLAMDVFDKAEDFFQKALYLDPFYHDVLLHMSLLHEKKGEPEKASILMERIKRANEKTVKN